MKKILLTAFEPFDGQQINASQEVARSLQKLRFEGAHLEVLNIPVERFKALEITLSAIESNQPDFVILLGEARGRAMVTPERVAINLDDYPIPDNAGNQPREETIVEGGPAAYFSTLPIATIQSAIEKAGVPAAISNSAGTYLCNHLFYGVVHHLAQMRSSTRAGFVHIPLLPEQKPEGVEHWASLPLEITRKGVQVAIETCISDSVL